MLFTITLNHLTWKGAISSSAVSLCSSITRTWQIRTLIPCAHPLRNSRWGPLNLDIADSPGKKLDFPQHYWMRNVAETSAFLHFLKRTHNGRSCFHTLTVEGAASECAVGRAVETGVLKTEPLTVLCLPCWGCKGRAGLLLNQLEGSIHREHPWEEKEGSVKGSLRGFSEHGEDCSQICGSAFFLRECVIQFLRWLVALVWNDRLSFVQTIDHVYGHERKCLSFFLSSLSLNFSL